MIDPDRINWAVVAGIVLAALFALWLSQLRRGRGGWSAGVVSFAFLAVAGLMGAAPFRSLVDQHYPGYSFGFLHAPGGLAVSLMASSVIVASMAACVLAARNLAGRPMWFVAAASLLLLINVGVSFVGGLISDIDQNTIQFGQYLTIPGAVATLPLLIVLVGPFGYGLIWASRRALRGGAIAG